MISDSNIHLLSLVINLDLPFRSRISCEDFKNYSELLKLAVKLLIYDDFNLIRSLVQPIIEHNEKYVTNLANMPHFLENYFNRS